MTTQFVSSGVVSSGVRVFQNDVLSGGTASATVVFGGGLEQVDAGGVASGTVFSQYGSEIVGLDIGAQVGTTNESVPSVQRFGPEFAALTTAVRCPYPE